jgi:hypothetical protein
MIPERNWLGSDASSLIANLNDLLRDLEGINLRGRVDFKCPAPEINQWALAKRAVPCLIGNVTGHPTLGNGATATSELFYIDPERGYARTLSRWYHLRTPIVPESFAFRSKPE